MKLAYERREIHLKNSVPVYQGKPAEVQRYVEELCEGFGAAFEIACNEKEQIRSLFEPLYSEEGRFLIRHTQQYGMYLTASLAPEFMKDARNRIYLLHILKKGQKSETGYAALFAYELEAMMNMEIPIYYFRGKGKELLDGAQKAYPEYFEQSAYESFLEKLQRLSAADLGRQQMLIRLSIGCSLPRTEESGFLSTEVIRGKGAQGNVFTRLGRHLAGLRIEAGGRQIWTRTDFSGQAWGMKAAGMDLYDGIPGIAAALAAVISAGGSREFDSL